MTFVDVNVVVFVENSDLGNFHSLSMRYEDYNGGAGGGGDCVEGLNIIECACK